MNEDIIAPTIALIVMLGWSIHFALFQRAIFTRSRREIMIWAVVNLVVVSVIMQVLYRFTLFFTQK